MLRRSLAFLLMLVFSSQTFYGAVIFADYMVNTKAYARNCENKAKPRMHCNGKCQMMKKIRKEEKKDQQNPERRAANKTENVLSSQSFYPVLPVFILSDKSNLSPSTSGKVVKMPRDLFHPPDA